MKDETVSGQNSAVVFLYLYATVNAVGLYWCVCVCVCGCEFCAELSVISGLIRDLPKSRSRHCFLCCTNKQLNNAAPLHLGRMCYIYVDLFVQGVCVSVCVCAPVNVYEHVCVCVCVCVSVYLAFVTKHPRCQRDTAGRRRKGREPGQEVSLHCCVPFQTVVLCFRLSHPGNLQLARRKNLAVLGLGVCGGVFGQHV